MSNEAAIVASLFSQPVPEGKVRWWCDDMQGGGGIEYITRAESDRRDAVLAAYWDHDGPEPDWDSYEGPWR